MYLRHIFKQNKLKLLIWSIILIGMNIALAPVFKDVLGKGDGLESLKATLDTPAMVALVGPIPEGPYSYAVAYAHEMLLFMAILHAIFNIIIARDISKKEETSGMTEVLISSGIQRNTLMNAYILFGFIVNTVITTLIFIGLTAINIETFTVEGNALYAIGLLLFGLLFFAITLLSANLFESLEVTFGIPLIILIASYLYRATTDVSNFKYSVVSPFNWLSRTFPYSENDWIWLMCFSVTLIILVVAAIIFRRRDINSGIIRLQINTRNCSIRSYSMLLYRTSWISLYSWLIGMFVIGLTYGAVFGDLKSLVDNTEVLKTAVESGSIQDPTMFFIHMMMLVTTVIATIPALILFNKLSTLEHTKRIEVANAGTLNKKFNRIKVILTHVLFAIIFGVTIQLASAIGMHVASINVTDLDLTFMDYVKTSLNFASVIIFVLSVSTLLYGMGRNIAKFIWAYVGYMFFISYIGTLMELPEWMHKLTLFYYLSEAPSEMIKYMPILITLGLSLVLVIIGAFLFNRRNLD